MKRLIKAYSRNLSKPYINSESALAIIENVDHECTAEKVKKDNNGMEALWGAVSDDGKYVMEIYLFDCNLAEKAAYVFAPIVNRQVTTDLQCVVMEVRGASNARQKAKDGIVSPFGDNITFENGYKSIEEAPEYVEQNENPDTV